MHSGRKCGLDEVRVKEVVKGQAREVVIGGEGHVNYTGNFQASSLFTKRAKKSLEDAECSVINPTRTILASGRERAWQQGR